MHIVGTFFKKGLKLVIHINSYSFGKIIINKCVYDRDIMVFPGKVISNWVRENGHVLAIEDLTEIIHSKPDVLIIGRGAMGKMNIPTSVKKDLENLNITLIEAKTDEACKIFNNEIKKDKKVIGAFHLTC